MDINMFPIKSCLKNKQNDQDINKHFVDGVRMQRVMRDVMDKKIRRRNLNNLAVKWKDDLLKEYPVDNLKEYKMANFNIPVQNDWSTVWNKREKCNLEKDKFDDAWYTYNPFEEDGWKDEMWLLYEGD